MFEKPLTETAAVAAEDPGTGNILILFLMHSFIKIPPGSEIVGVPASEMIEIILFSFSKFNTFLMFVFSIYLNDVEEGGGTGFPNLDVEIEAKKGDVLVFHNTPPDSNKIHPKSLHAGLPVIAGEKWAINLWFRERLRY